MTTAVDTITMGQAPRGIEVYNRGTPDDLWVTVNGVDPVTSAATADVVPAGTTLVLDTDSDGPNVIKLLGNGNAYSLRVL